MSLSPLVITDLTTGSIGGDGVFDKMMATNKAILELEYGKDRIKGAEYAQVFLGTMDTTMNQAMQFLLQSRRMEVELALIEQQVLLAQVEILKANVELEILEASKEKIAAEVLQIEAQTLLIGQQKTNLIAEAANIPKQGLMLDAQKAHVLQQTTNLIAEASNIPKQGLILDTQKANLVSEGLGIVARTALTTQQEVNAHSEDAVLIAQECKLRAEFDLLLKTNIKTTAETTLLNQKTATEKSQTLATGVDDNSVVGKQKSLYQAQTDGFKRDAEQKVAKIMVDTWNARRMTDESTVADSTNKLNDASVGRAVDKLLTGVNA